MKPKRQLFTLHLLLEPQQAIKQVTLKGMSTRGFYDMTLDEARPETLVLVNACVYDVIRWHDESPTPLVWSIQGDALESIV